MSKKLKNIKAVNEMLLGEHKTQTKKTISFEGAKFVKKEVGETWIDDDGQSWEQKNGYRVKVGKFAKLREDLKAFPNCNKETCTCIEPSQADLKMKAYHGMCLDCVVDMEHTMKLEGDYDEYERKKLLSNGEAWLTNAEVEKEVLKSTIKAAFVNEDGSIEEWSGGSEEDVIAKIDNGFKKFKTDFIEKLKVDIKTDKVIND